MANTPNSTRKGELAGGSDKNPDTDAYGVEIVEWKLVQHSDIHAEAAISQLPLHLNISTKIRRDLPRSTLFHSELSYSFPYMEITHTLCSVSILHL